MHHLLFSSLTKHSPALLKATISSRPYVTDTLTNFAYNTITAPTDREEIDAAQKANGGKPVGAILHKRPLSDFCSSTSVGELLASEITEQAPPETKPTKYWNNLIENPKNRVLSPNEATKLTSKLYQKGHMTLAGYAAFGELTAEESMGR